MSRWLNSICCAVVFSGLLTACLGMGKPAPIETDTDSVEVVETYDPALTMDAIASRITLISSGTAYDRLQRIGKRMWAAAEMSEETSEVEFLLINGPSENGWMLPPAFIAITNDMMRETTDAQLAAVLGHLLAHIKMGNHRRLVEIIQFDSGDLKMTDFQGLNADDEIRFASARVVADLAATGFEKAPVPQGMAIEADHEGAFMMARAGYDPREAISFWERMSDIAKERGRRPLFMIVYDAGRDRLLRLKARMPDYLHAYGEYNQSLLAKTKSPKEKQKEKSGLFDWWD